MLSGASNDVGREMEVLLYGVAGGFDARSRRTRSRNCATVVHGNAASAAPCAAAHRRRIDGLNDTFPGMIDGSEKRGAEAAAAKLSNHCPIASASAAAIADELLQRERPERAVRHSPSMRRRRGSQT